MRASPTRTPGGRYAVSEVPAGQPHQAEILRGVRYSASALIRRANKGQDPALSVPRATLPGGSRGRAAPEHPPFPAPAVRHTDPEAPRGLDRRGAGRARAVTGGTAYSG